MKRNQAIDAVADSAAEVAADAAEAGASQLKKFFDDVEDLLHRVSPLGDEDLERIRTRVQTSLRSLRNAADRQVRQALDVSSRAAHATDDYVRESPWKAIGIAAIAALAVGSLVMSRRER
jgi:ElaB/YqjD/DUF883 family membrane-anchored ribosome-binding protein